MAPKLICLDMDGVLFQPANFWLELHRVLGTEQQGKELTKKYLHTDYQRLVHEVVFTLWKGKKAEPYHQLIQSIPYMPGIKELFQHIKRQDWLTAILSSGSIDLARRAQHDWGIDFIYANELVIKEGKITGEFIFPMGSGTKEKAQIVQHLAQDLGIPLQDIVFVGDSETEREAFKIVGKSIAFNAKDELLRKTATHIVDELDLRKIVPLLKSNTSAK